MRKVDPVKHERKRRQILRAAEICFRRDGFRGATISSICLEAEMSPGHLYHYFESKEAIVETMTALHLKELEHQLDEVLTTNDVVATFCHELEKFWKYKSRKKNQNALLITEVLAEAGRNPAIARILSHRNQRLAEMITALLRKGQQMGQVDQAIDTKAAAPILLSLLDASTNLFIRNPSFKMDDALALLNRMIERFLVPSQPPARKQA
jgi:TetR/AcrR family transcriptional repressor of uid operon